MGHICQVMLGGIERCVVLGTTFLLHLLTCIDGITQVVRAEVDISDPTLDCRCHACEGVQGCGIVTRGASLFPQQLRVHSRIASVWYICTRMLPRAARLLLKLRTTRTRGTFLLSCCHCEARPMRSRVMRRIHYHVWITHPSEYEPRSKGTSAPEHYSAQDKSAKEANGTSLIRIRFAWQSVRVSPRNVAASGETRLLMRYLCGGDGRL